MTSDLEPTLAHDKVKVFEPTDLAPYTRQMAQNYSKYSVPFEHFQLLTERIDRSDRIFAHPLLHFSHLKPDTGVHVGLRFDVDADPWTAVRMARHLARIGIGGSFYLLPTSPYYGHYSEDHFIRNAYVKHLVRDMIVAGCEIGLHNDAMHIHATSNIDGAHATAAEIQWLRSQGAQIDGTVGHNSIVVYGFENSELFKRRVLWERPSFGFPTGVLDEEKLHLQYEGTFAQLKKNVDLIDAKAFSSDRNAADIRSEEWMKTYLTANPCHDWSVDLQIWALGCGSWVIGGSNKHRDIFEWDLNIHQVCDFLGDAPDGSRILVVLHPGYFRGSNSTLWSSTLPPSTSKKAAPIKKAASLKNFATAKLTELGRPLRVLMIGNIANNAYLNGKILNESGIDSYTCSIGYKHIMGCPEWEDADFSEQVDQLNPNWDAIELKGFVRPHWFINDELPDCMEKLYNICSTTVTSDTEELPEELPEELDTTKLRRQIHSAKRLRSLLRRMATGNIHFNTILKNYAVRFRTLRNRMFRRKPDLPEYTLRSLQEYGLLPSDYRPYITSIPLWESVLKPFDIVIGYGVEGMYPMMALKKPYIAFEHGTIRGIPFQGDSLARLCSATYQNADHVILTNCDAIKSTAPLGITEYSFVPHPVNETLPDPSCAEQLRAQLQDEVKADFIIFHPARQHWEPGKRDPSLEKGNDIFLKGLAEANSRGDTRFGAVMVSWGASLEDSRKMIDELGMTSLVKWVEPLPHIRMAEMILATDAVADQFYLGAFGSLTPKGLMLGRPVLLNLNEDVHSWCFEELPPVLNTKTPAEVAEALLSLAKDPDFYRTCSEQGVDWYRREHSNSVVGLRFKHVFEQVLGAGSSRPTKIVENATSRT